MRAQAQRRAPARKPPVATRKDTFLTDTINNKKRSDGWVNILQGLGTSKDSRTAAYVDWKPMTEHDIEYTYAGAAMAKKVVDLPVEEAMQDGYKWTGITTEQEKTLIERLEQLRFDNTIIEGAVKGRLYGGSGILKAYNDDLRLELPKTREDNREIKALVVFNRFELYTTWEDVNKDMLSPDFGKPLLYTFLGRGASAATAGNLKIHASRLVRFDGAWLPDRLRQSNSYWNDSVLNRPYDAIRNYANAHDSVNAAVKDLSVAVFKIKGLADDMASNCDEKVISRLEMVNLAKSIARAVVVDSEGEDFEYKARNLTGASELVDHAEGRLSAEVDIPQTILFGTSPKGGIGQSGEHELNNWYSFVENLQKKMLAPAMLEIAKEVCDELKIPSQKLGIEFNPLWSLSEKEEAEMRHKNASTDQIYLQEGVLAADEVRTSRFGGAKYSMETTLDKGVDLTKLKPGEDPELEAQLRAKKPPTKDA